MRERVCGEGVGGAGGEALLIECVEDYEGPKGGY